MANEGFGDLLIEHFYDAGRCAVRREQSKPDGIVVARYHRLRDRWHLGQPGGPLRVTCTEDLEPARFDVRPSLPARAE